MAGNLDRRHAGATVASRVVAVLRAFDAEHRALGLSQIARRADLPVATAHRLIGELVEGGVLVRQDSGRYVIGKLIWDLGLLAPVQSELREVASPFLHDIYGATLSTVHLAIREGTEVLYVARFSGHQSVPVVSKVGARLPLHTTGVGKVLLAYAPAEVQRQVLSQLRRVTPYTITQPGRLDRELSDVRASGFATTHEEMTLGACSVAVPIFAGEQVIASVGLVVPSLRSGRDRLIAALHVAARGISRSLPPDFH